MVGKCAGKERLTKGAFEAEGVLGKDETIESYK